MADITLESDGTVYDGREKVAKIGGDGVVRDTHNVLIGKIASDGTVCDRYNVKRGKIFPDGTVRDNHNVTKGKVAPDGTVRDSHNTKIGTAKCKNGNLPANWAAAYFFLLR